MTNNPVCFVCGVSDASCVLSTKPQSKGAYFTFLASHAPPDGADLPDSEGFVSACIICKAFLTEQWNSYERHKTPIVERIFWLKRMDDQAFTGAEINVQGELVAQFIGINNNGLSASMDEMFDHTSRESGKLRRKTPRSSFQEVHNDTEDTSSSCDDVSGVLDLSTSPRKFTSKIPAHNDQGFVKLLPSIKSRQVVSERKTRSRLNLLHNISTFVCYICQGTYASPQKSRFLSCTYTSDDEPYFPFVLTLSRPNGAKEITKSGLAEVCCDCRKTLSRQWRVFETRKIPIEKRVYDIESLITSSNSGNHYDIDDQIPSSVISDLAFSKNSNARSEVFIRSPKCFACLQTTNVLQNINGSFLRDKSEYVISLLPLSKKLLGMYNKMGSDVLCCEKCLQILLLERQVLDRSAIVPNNLTAQKGLSTISDHSHKENSKTNCKEELARFNREIKTDSSHFAPEINLSSSDSSQELILNQNKCHLSASFSGVCFVCQKMLKDPDLSSTNQKSSVIQYLITLMSSCDYVKHSGEIQFCGKCSDYLLPSLLKDLRHIPLRKDILNGSCKSSKQLVCLFCSSKEETSEPNFLSVNVRDLTENLRSTQTENLLRLGVRNLVTCRHCFKSGSEPLKRKLSAGPHGRRKKHKGKDVRERPDDNDEDDDGDEGDNDNDTCGGETNESIKDLTSRNGCQEGGIEFMLEHESASGLENAKEHEEDTACAPSVASSQMSNSDVRLENSCFNANVTGTPGTPCSSSQHDQRTPPSINSPVPLSSTSPYDFQQGASSLSEIKTSSVKRFSPFMSGHLDPLCMVHYHLLVNQLLTNQDWNNEKQMGHLQGMRESLMSLTRSANQSLPTVLPHFTRCSTVKALHDIKSDGASTDGSYCKSSFYRPFSDDDGRAIKNSANHQRNGSECAPDRCSSVDETCQDSWRSDTATTLTNSNSDDTKDERLTAALGLISLCHSNVSNGKEENSKSVKTHKVKDSVLEEKVTPCAGLSIQVECTNLGAHDSRSKKLNNGEIMGGLGHSKVIRWPGVSAIIESYHKHLRDLMVERKCLQSAQCGLLKKKDELIHSKIGIEISLKHLHLEKESLIEENKRVAEQILMLKNCLKNLKED